MRTCKFEDCERKHKAKGFCATHYENLRRGSYLGEIKPIQPRRKMYEPGSPKLRYGKYVSYLWPEHPIATGREVKRVQESYLLYWQQSGYDPGVLKELCKPKTQVHHIDGDYENISAVLELSTVGKHTGTSESDKAKHLTSLGYRVHPPLWKIKRGN